MYSSTTAVMSSPELHSGSPSAKIRVEIAEDAEKNSIGGDPTADNIRIDLTEEEVCCPIETNNSRLLTVLLC
jgi:hypothetical protein